MKELSVEEKAIAYDKAIERAKSTADAELIELIFPELKESEDERIRKALRKRIIRYDPNNEILIKEEGISQKQFLAWLEKQEETKYEIFDYDYAKFTLRTIESWIINGYKNVSPYDKERIKKGINLLEHLLSSNKQAEQKPVWSEEDEKKSLKIKCLIGYYRTGNDEYELCSWIDKFKNRMQQPKQWSEEDEKNLLEISRLISNYRPGDDGYKLDSWLKSLKKRIE